MLATMGRVAVCVEKAAWAETAVQESGEGIVRWEEQTSRRLGRRDGIFVFVGGFGRRPHSFEVARSAAATRNSTTCCTA